MLSLMDLSRDTTRTPFEGSCVTAVCAAAHVRRKFPPAFPILRRSPLFLVCDQRPSEYGELRYYFAFFAFS